MHAFENYNSVYQNRRFCAVSIFKHLSICDKLILHVRQYMHGLPTGVGIMRFTI